MNRLLSALRICDVSNIIYILMLTKYFIDISTGEYVELHM